MIFNCFSFQVAMSSRLLSCSSVVSLLQTVHLIAEGQETQNTILVVLDGLANILAAAGEMDEPAKVSLHVEECGVLGCIEYSQSHENNEIYYMTLTKQNRVAMTNSTTRHLNKPPKEVSHSKFCHLKFFFLPLPTVNIFFHFFNAILIKSFGLFFEVFFLV